MRVQNGRDELSLVRGALAPGFGITPGPVGRESRRAEGVENSVQGTAPDLSRAVEVASPRISFESDRSYRKNIVKWRTHGAAQIRRGIMFEDCASSTRRGLRPTTAYRYLKMIGMIRMATMFSTLIIGLMAGAAAFLWRSPTVSPVTPSCCAGDPLPPCTAASINLYA